MKDGAAALRDGSSQCLPSHFETWGDLLARNRSLPLLRYWRKPYHRSRKNTLLSIICSSASDLALFQITEGLAILVIELPPQLSATENLSYGWIIYKASTWESTGTQSTTNLISSIRVSMISTSSPNRYISPHRRRLRNTRTRNLRARSPSITSCSLGYFSAFSPPFFRSRQRLLLRR